MKETRRTEQADEKNPLRRWVPVFALSLVSGFLLVRFPQSQKSFNENFYSYTMEMLTVFPAVLVLMGLLTVFISKEFISRYLGEGSGLRGFAVAVFLGTLPTGPLYVAFPLASALKKKGARTANLVIFLSSWACIKLPQELAELRFLGPDFMLTRLILTLVAVVVMGLIVEKFVDAADRMPS